MMAGLFLIFSICMLLIYFEHRNLAFGLIAVNIFLALLMLLHHATEILNIRL